MNECSFVAEVSSNHCLAAGAATSAGPSLERALAFVDAAARIGCRAVKFQQFRVAELFAPEALARDPKLRARHAWETPEAFHRLLSERARGLGLAYACTPFYRRAIDVLEPWVDMFKLSSYQVLDLAFLRGVAATGKPITLATGMATLDEVRAAVDALRQGGCRELVLLHCVSSYPTPPQESNLRAIESLARRFDCPSGWSDHSADARVVERAVRRFGASMLEFHLDLDGRGAEFGFGHCWLPEQIAPLVAALRSGANDSEQGGDAPWDGDGIKRPQPSEMPDRAWRSDPRDGLRPLRAERARLATTRPEHGERAA